MSNAQLLASLESHNSAFEALLSLIPARHYIRDETVDDEVRTTHRTLSRPASPCMRSGFVADISCPCRVLLLVQHDNKYMKNKKNKATPKQELKERSKKAKKDKVSSDSPPSLRRQLHRAAHDSSEPTLTREYTLRRHTSDMLPLSVVVITSSTLPTT